MTRQASILFSMAAAATLFAMPAFASAASLAEFGRCLGKKGAVFYGTSWCPHCRTQRDSLGEAMSGVRYVECSVGGGRDNSPACSSAGVESFPTWIFGDGSRANGLLSIGALAAKTGCEAPSSKQSGSGQTSPAVKSKPSGPKILEIPQ